MFQCCDCFTHSLLTFGFQQAVLKYSNSSSSAVQADSVRERLEACRGGSVDSPIFARELAFIIEKFGKGSMEEAQEILHLYLRGAKNLDLAVGYAERSKHSREMWDILVEFCTTPDPTSNTDQTPGALFGSLLEAAAHTMSDLGSLVSRIPEGMSIEGLRPKLIAAITDYRHKVKIHEQVDSMLMDDKVSVLRELSHVSRRGKRLDADAERELVARMSKDSSIKAARRGLLKSQRLKTPPGHSFSLPIR